MSASPTAAPTQSTKRPLEDPSSPSSPNDQPEAKRPALDKIIKNASEDEPLVERPASTSNGATKETTDGNKAEELKDEQGDTIVTDAPGKSIESTGSTTTRGQSAGGNQTHDESGWIHIRAVITSAEAATVIGKGGENVSLIRKMSGAKCTVSDYQKGAVERILTVSGVVDAAAKVNISNHPCNVQTNHLLGLWTHYSHTQ